MQTKEKKRINMERKILVLLWVKRSRRQQESQKEMDRVIWKLKPLPSALSRVLGYSWFLVNQR